MTMPRSDAPLFDPDAYRLTETAGGIDRPGPPAWARKIRRAGGTV